MKNILILGGDGYLGYALSVYLAERDYQVTVMDSLLKFKNTTSLDCAPVNPYVDYIEKYDRYNKLSGKKITAVIADCANYLELEDCILRSNPESIIHMAEQPSAPLSMLSYDTSYQTLTNNVIGTFNLAQAIIRNNMSAQIIKLGTMGEYGTPNIDIEEGWININHNSRNDTFLYPRQASSLYHTTKILDTDLLWFYVRNNKINVIDLMQGPVYGFEIDELTKYGLNLEIYYDEIFGTVLNRFVVQAAIGHDLTIYGSGNQIRGYINIKDSMKCIELALQNKKNGLQIFNQFTEQFSVNDLANLVIDAASKCGIDAKKEALKILEMKKEEHYYNAKNHKLLELGLRPEFLTSDEIAKFITKIDKTLIDKSKIEPNTIW